MVPTPTPADSSSALSLRFLGVGNARASALGSAAAVLERAGMPALLIDCGPRTLDDYTAQYGGARHADSGEVLFHDCGLHGSPAHAGLDDLQREYGVEVLQRVVAYHYESAEAGDRIAAAGLRVARPGVAHPLPDANAVTADTPL